MAYIPYAEKLKDPRWQKCRLEVLDRNNWTCQYCNDTKATLHVHHLCYNSVTRDPWDVDTYALLCICEVCHKVEHLKDLTELESAIISQIQITAMCFSGTSELYNIFVRGINELILKHKG